MSSPSVLLLVGAVGVGKTDTSYRIFDRIVLAGGIETAEQCALYRAQVSDADWTVVRLRLTDHEQRRQRLPGRGLGFGMTAAEIESWIRTGSDEEHHLDGESFSDTVIDTDDADRADVLDRVLDAAGWR